MARSSSPMTLDERSPPRRLALTAFLVATVTSLFVGIVGFGDPWQEVIVRAVGIEVGAAIGFTSTSRCGATPEHRSS